MATSKDNAIALSGPFEIDSQTGLHHVNPWMNEPPNCLKHSGSDWYRITLAASLGGRIIHGVNTAPSMEVLGKSPVTPDETTSAGFIRWDPSTFDETSIGHRLSDQFYVHHHYRGGLTKSGALLAFDEGAWEPSLRCRARASSLLAAGLIAHGIAKADALEVVSKITSDEVDPEAVESTLLPSSHLKREMVTVSKASHRVFSQGTLQRGITWDDSRLNQSKHLPHVAYDWGRITAIARYIAESNVQICPMFRHLALGMGVPYHVVRNAWAEVANEDYQLTPSMFKGVRHIDLTSLNVPSIKGAYKEHDQEVFMALTRFLSNEPDHPSSDIYKGHVYLKRAAEAQMNKKRRLKIASVHEIGDNIETVHSVDDRKLKRQLKGICSSQTLLAAAVKTRKMNDVTFKRAIDSYVENPNNATKDDLNNLAKVVFGQGTWSLTIAAAKDAARKIQDDTMHGRAHELLVTQLGNLKSQLFGFKTYLDSPVIFSDDALKKLVEHLPELLKRCDKASALTVINKHDLMTPDMIQVDAVLTYENEKTSALIEHIRNKAAPQYKKAALVLLQYQTPDVRNLGACHYYTYVALKTLGTRLAVSRASGYIDGSVPKETYVYKAAKKLAVKYNFGKPKLRYPNYITAISMAEEMNSACDLGYDAKEAVGRTINVLGMATGDLLVGNPFTPPEGLLEEAMDAIPTPGSPLYETQDIEDQQNLEILTALMQGVDEEFMKGSIDPYTRALNSYTSTSQAEEYAKINGYASFKDAFDMLGLKAFNDDDNNFVIIAKSFLEPKGKTKKKSSSGVRYQPLR